MSPPSVESHTRVSRFGMVNVFLVQEDDGLTVIDTAITGSAKPILAAADRLSAPIARILLTHAHGDHVGSLDALAAKVPDAEVLISSRDAILLGKDKTLAARGVRKAPRRLSRHVDQAHADGRGR